MLSVEKVLCKHSSFFTASWTSGDGRWGYWGPPIALHITAIRSSTQARSNSECRPVHTRC